MSRKADNASLVVILGNQLFPVEELEKEKGSPIFMAEDLGLCTYVRHHQQKIVLFLAAMRAYRDALGDAGFDVRYEEFDADAGSYEKKLAAAVEASGCRELVYFEIEDKAMEHRMRTFAGVHDLDTRELESPMFLCSRKRFADYLDEAKRPFMAEFYKQERRRLGILVDDDGNPEGGRWSYDEENRKKLPRSVEPPEIAKADRTEHVDAVIGLVKEHFAEHPGDADDFWWPTTRDAALEWLDDFLEQRFEDFGPYEDAITKRSRTVFHSVLSPLINIGLLTPAEVLERALDYAGDHDVPMQSIEGFVRQVMGWREFIRGIYRHFDADQEDANHWGHERELTAAWYEGNTGIPPLDDTIRTAQELGWTHHIPRLMVAANLMTLCEIRPQSAWRWFMEMYVDSSEWVMGPNVYGMGLFSDGGIFATKPYICGSNYLRKMSDYGKGDWCDIVDGLYWRFIDKHREFFESQQRLSLMPKALDRLSAERRERIFSAAESFLSEYTD
ncbi:MAG: cryptochrome/photolyase family protein [Woeseiaceae bacterium]|nr:cryptochrome/photolyase family protein [Woeseiaceae bacterium]